MASDRQLALPLSDHRPGRTRQGTSPRGHGTRACYIAGCRNPACRRANADYQMAYRDYYGGNRRKGDPRLPRGTIET